ncbi:MAG: hypothetical protein COX12_00690 [Candidatus Brennerbacteria bacterium CG23_combo_of_CG06-09_8_20_14_all_44_41]|uniref:Homing endonuclease LAGLIDADG domain-containing protein n=1 Tax=Candidatus Brennerbacteria bacterium CG_4_8_14_3_um_filter_43_14 TaxID=1974521 RepID=A0A2H9N642_9BACT|nr:MAG: hypothetical protein AUJ43_00215 [Parcubacteria group bacterium CG1_02_44_31]PIP50532.1 MAG: hypothetical protein COX12_00690 [Candidatus Brennerbacteria bacterium CG23_combo_of_CG06-09_8_20_14_all_44_41]PIX29365.1 MAG: hypothetical protein COZ64_00225 [Candidatus Brennerbacteria bacterium CG_4_8_14_3_um_filter_43_14]
MKFTKRQKAILIGTILGDAYLQKTGKRNARLCLEHENKQKEYLLWKVSAFKNLFQGKPVFVKRVHPKTKKMYEYWRFQSNSTPELGKMQRLFYKNGKKIIPSNFQELFKEPLSLAVWFMDDGYYYPRDNNAYLYLGKLSLDETKIVQDTLINNLRLKTKILDKKQEGFVIYFSPSETQKLKTIIGPYIIPCLMYKIPS